MYKKSYCLVRVALFLALIFGVASLLCAFFVGKKVFADEKYDATVRNYNGVDYGGLLIDANNVGEFSEKIDLTGSDLETPIFQFVITPSIRGNGSVYSPDFEKLTFTFSDPTGKTLTIGFIPRKADNPRYKYICGLAKGENQDLLGEHHNNLNNIEEDGAYLTNVYSSILPYTFDGYGADKSWFPFYDKNGNAFSGGCNGVISIYYSAEENAVYSDIGYKWLDDDTSEGKEWTLTDNYTLSKSGERRYRIRDLDKADYKKGDNVISTVWSGFNDIANITCKVNFSNLVTDDPSILLISLGGKNLADNYYAESLTKGIKNVSYPIPKPYYFSKGNSYDFISLKGKVEITDGSNVVLSERLYKKGLTFTPTTVGKYYADYKVTDPNDGSEYNYRFTIVVLDDSEGTVLKTKGYDREYYLYETVDLGYDIENNVQTLLPDVQLKIYKDDVLLKTVSSANDDDFKNGLSYLYKFENVGNYICEYSSVDILGRETKERRIYNVGGYFLKIKDGLNSSATYSDVSDMTRPSTKDFSVINILTGEKVNPTGTSIKVSKNGGEYANYTAGIFNGDGIYNIRYVYSFGTEQLVAEREIAVFKELSSINISAIPQNTILATDSTVKDDVVRVIGLKGTTVNISSALFSSDKNLTVKLFANDVLTDVTDEYYAGSLSVVLADDTEYALIASMETENGYTVKKTLVISSENGYIFIAPVSDMTANVGHEITLPVPDAFDLYGNRISGGTFSVKFNGENVNVAGGRFLPKEIGIYKITYTVTNGNTVKSCGFEYVVNDTEAPIIRLDGVKNTGSQGKFISVYDFNASDNSDKDLNISVRVSFDGEDVSLYDGGFSAEKQGEYSVRIIVTDMSGNSSVKEYTIAVAAGGCSSALNAGSITGLMILLCIAITLIVSFELKYKDKKHKE